MTGWVLTEQDNSHSRLALKVEGIETGAGEPNPTVIVQVACAVTGVDSTASSNRAVNLRGGGGELH